MSIEIKELEAVIGRGVYISERSESGRSLGGKLGLTPTLNSNQWRYPYSVIFVRPGIMKDGDMINYVTIPHTRSELRQEDNKIYIEADVLSNPGLILFNDTQYEYYEQLMSKT